MSQPIGSQAALLLAMMINAAAFAQIETSSTVWPYHPNRPGAEAYLHGGAFAAYTGSATAVLFNPAGLAPPATRFFVLVEGGWHSSTDQLDFSNSQFAADFQPLQFAVGTARLADRLTAGLFYARPTDYRLELRPPEALESAVPFLQRQYATVGLGVAAEVTSQVRVGAEMEWRQAELQDDFSFYASSGHAHDWRFSAGVITAWRDWQFGLVARSSYLAHGEQSFEPALQATKLESQQTPAGSSQPEITSAASSSFSAEEPALLRLGLMTPPIAQRLRVSADAEFQNFDSNAPILRWQFYTGAAMRISSALEWGWGCFTFRKDYSAFVDGPVSEIFLTTGATVQIAALRLTASYMNGDLFNSDFAGQQFVNVALGCGIP